MKNEKAYRIGFAFLAGIATAVLIYLSGALIHLITYAFMGGWHLVK